MILLHEYLQKLPSESFDNGLTQWKNTFEIKCRSHDPIKEVDFRMGEIQYIEPNKSVTRFSAKDSFCIVNMQRNPKIYLYFNFCNPKELIDNKIKNESTK
ncbi:hypothetical protein DDB_G0273161 [Dictyostelium discoideum AX4]|uniref:Uncharacterized protein n=1 Tax=Dictyostelium discoideum TaxID=44689 RepID=Q556P9_DICDI|nr:hypothetical protein DDB_G0273911 [Dictyostelium discoideum AX4]XP_644679.1 hypothetical protein DDB_G0273161 [Dictyostelium discoideum AX4]EAL70646.1 hypothetical protein DDB_G0273911 [Dictyostelium discoideum AX4]EAL70798.1 hypothetical protein DDB_G0273161 [Dictyostelium discoideum AX4]|eukprot:XP_644572.1 hypothetical protein DDB_G0273911 [Dictyostelium discoideum AX4]